jgi:integrative and conjugative element protein (TIGR02256 family)
VTESAFGQVRQAAADALPFETGGIVLGTRTAQGVWITRFAEVLATAPHRRSFQIPAGGTHAIVDEAKRADQRVGYLGDWHTHPVDVGPSGIDFATLQDLAKGVFARRRLLALIRRGDEEWSLDLWILNTLRRPVALDYELTGPLAPSTARGETDQT